MTHVLNAAPRMVRAAPWRKPIEQPRLLSQQGACRNDRVSFGSLAKRHWAGVIAQASSCKRRDRVDAEQPHMDMEHEKEVSADPADDHNSVADKTALSSPQRAQR